MSDLHFVLVLLVVCCLTSCPAISKSLVHKLVRTRKIRVHREGEWKRTSDPALRLEEGQQIHVYSQSYADSIALSKDENDNKNLIMTEAEMQRLRSCVIYQDDRCIIVNKPAGLSVQGGTGTRRHLDGLLHCLVDDDAERPKLVHRLDRDTSGCLALGRSKKDASVLATMFRQGDVDKSYIALIGGIPEKVVLEALLALKYF
ncbi:pseudouridine synthase protein, RluA family [Guillardia theta CCMP2712]|uniref:Pseudouridine synthase protein, RluA family n=1 Tax=Guillardia theta (strain CCMP2712) TaxID=905079 RepID=L1JZ94_GUITC|nr:pseudouridine synthase protein, RluA family [Guillardia theta CCMP2712]EKX53687.1 pseudouridine synthase protein, RluA family [Guillardia theta CCMP2712]|eukprot:XP_005840667.1 pseudouridine synthase protein, RluA family [Guillardia theta CCMP2712]